MRILTLGEPKLRLKSENLEVFDDELKQLISDMFNTMYTGNGIGLAAVQVGVLKRIFIMHIPNDEQRVFINPEILETSIEMSKYEEGCLSIPGINANVERPYAVKVQAFDLNGKPFILKAEDLAATVIQHENDHLNGKLFVDHLPEKKREKLIKEYKKKVVL
jgi:peptide deformylase